MPGTPRDSGNSAPGAPDLGIDATTTVRKPPLLRAAGFLLGTVTALVATAYLLVGGVILGPAMLWSRTQAGARRRYRAGANRLVNLELHRRAYFFGDAFPTLRNDEGALTYLAARAAAGLLADVVLTLLGVGLILAALIIWGLVRGSIGVVELVTQVFLGGILLFVNLQGILALAALDGRLVRRHFGPSERELLQRRITELSVSRAGVVQAVDHERRRIERDLHDGLQQRLVALAMLLGRARRRGPEQAAQLLEQSHREVEEVLVELREVAWRAFPSALDSLGLSAALAGVAERSVIPVQVDVEPGISLSRPVRTAAYFVVSETVTNAAKHSGASTVTVRVGRTADNLQVRVADDGIGGADAAGSGLSGLQLRVAALDGQMTVTSPIGGPTEIIVEIPCE